MASCGNQQFCTLCLEDDISKKAVTWCIDCGTFLCSICKRHHKRNKSSKDHRTISVEEYENLPAFILYTSNRCVEHDKRYELYCRFHESACCVQCINDQHKNCRDLPLLSDVLGNIKSSAAMFQLEKDILDIKESFDEIEKIMSIKTETLDKQKENCVADIQRIRTQINCHLDKLEYQLLEKLSTEYTKLKSDAEKLTKELEERRKRIDRLCDDFLKMKTFATDLQIFVGSKIADDKKKEESEYIENLQSSGKLDTTYLEVMVSADVTSVVNDIKSFGEISHHSIAVGLQLKTGEKIREQMPVKQVTDITHLTPKLQKSIKMPEKSQKLIITGCQILTDGQMLFVDYVNKCLMLFSEDGVYIRDVVTFDLELWDVCYISDKTVAVTLCNAEKVQIIDVKENKITKSFGTNYKCYGIDCYERSLIVTTGFPYGVLSIDLDKEVVSKVITLDSLSTGITCFENNIYVVSLRKKSVKCYQRNGELLWTYKDESVKEPCSLSIDRDGFIYVSCKGSHKIVVLTPDGKQGRVILSDTDGLDCPRTINIDKRTSTLLVGNLDDGRAFLFQI